MIQKDITWDWKLQNLRWFRNNLYLCNLLLQWITFFPFNCKSFCKSAHMRFVWWWFFKYRSFLNDSFHARLCKLSLSWLCATYNQNFVWFMVAFCIIQLFKRSRCLKIILILLKIVKALYLYFNELKVFHAFIILYLTEFIWRKARLFLYFNRSLWK